MQVDAIEERPAELAQISLDDGSRAPAFARGVSVVPAGAPVQFSTERVQSLSAELNEPPSRFVFNGESPETLRVAWCLLNLLER